MIELPPDDQPQETDDEVRLVLRNKFLKTVRVESELAGISIVDYIKRAVATQQILDEYRRDDYTIGVSQNNFGTISILGFAYDDPELSMLELEED